MILSLRLKKLFQYLILLLGSLFISACMDAEQLLFLDDNSVVREGKVNDIMRDMAASVSLIEDASIESLSPSERRETVLGELETILHLAERLQSEALIEEAMNSMDEHETIRQYLTQLTVEVKSAIEAVAQPSPDYFIAGSLAGACRACHDDFWVSR